jgi:hypothetical protein
LLLHNKVTAFVKKISICKQKVVNENTDMFPWTNDFIEENELGLEVIKNVILSHLTTLVTQFEKYFPTDWDIEKHDWIRQSFSVPPEKTQHLPLTAQEELAELSSDRTLQLVFQNKDMCDFWLTVQNEYPVVAELAVHVILPFATSYLCESAFSALTYSKSKYRTRLANVEADLRAALSDIEPRFDLLCSRMQAHPPH